MNPQHKQDILALIRNSRDAIVCSIDAEGYPNAKTMFVRKREGLTTFWFSTNTSAIRTQQWLERPQASVYFVDAKDFHGLMWTGSIRVYTDADTKQRLWQPGDEQYYPLGLTDPDYCILRFTAEHGNYYHGLQKHLFGAAELTG